MWTHLQPYLESQLTASSISRNAHVAIYRALNLRRLVAMTGSGATNSFGLPCWRDMGALFVEETNNELKKYKDYRKDKPVSAFDQIVQIQIAPLIAQVHTLTGVEDTPTDDPFEIRAKPEQLKQVQDFTLISNLCEAILKGLPDDPESGATRLHNARRALAQHFRNKEAKIVATRLRLLSLLNGTGKERSAGDGFEAFRKSADELGLYLAALGYLATHDSAEEALAEFLAPVDLETNPHAQNVFSSEKKKSGPVIPYDTTKTGPGRNIVDTLLFDLDISRVATLNYDVQVERAVFDRLYRTGDDESDPFFDLCKDYKTDRPQNRSLLIESGAKKGAVSITLNARNVGEIVNFAAHSRRFDRQIMHLHGRFDDPDNMVITETDYRRVYIRQSVARDIFREAQETLFGGNDILLVGVGMNENDVKRPFRRFGAQRESEEISTRRIFLMRESCYCTRTCVNQASCDSCRNANDAIALRQKINYNIHTIFFGGPRYRQTKARLGAISKSIHDVLQSRGDERKYERARSIFNECKNELEKFRQLALDGSSTFLLSPPEIRLLEHLKEKLPELPEHSKSEKIQQDFGMLPPMLRELSGRVTSRALCRQLQQLKDETKLWWDAWRHSPYERRAVYHMAHKRICGATSYLWVRHCPALPSTPSVNIDDTAKFIRRQNKAIEDELRAHYERSGRRSPAPARGKGRRVLRVAVPPGGGKGSFVRLLMNKDVHGRLFAENGEGQEYAAAFIAHLTFSMEFSSVAKALTRFLARRAAELQLKDVPKDAVKCERLANQHVGDDRLASQLSQEELTGIVARSVRDLKRELVEAAQTSRSVTGQMRWRGLLEEFAVADRNVDFSKVERAVSTREKVNDNDWFALARRLFATRREARPRLLDRPGFFSVTQLPFEPLRQHRLDLLRSVLCELQSRSADESERLFVCLSGIEQICDHRGDGRNPMHRALFRLLMGKTKTDTGPAGGDPDPPIDYFLVSGSPDTPICFLSEEYESPDKFPIPPEEDKWYSRTSRTGRVLRKWPLLSRLSWEDRLEIAKDAHIAARPAEARDWDSATQRFLDWAAQHGAAARSYRVTEIRSTGYIHRALWRSVFLTGLVLSAWKEHAKDVDLEVFLQSLDGAAARNGDHGVIGAVLAAYSELDRKSHIDAAVTHLDDLILRHLSLFSLPVEPWVLMDCPMIGQRLMNFYSPVDSDKRKVWRKWHLRKSMLSALRKRLFELDARGLVITVMPSNDPGDVRFGEEMSSEQFLHRRFAVHPKLREFLSYKMQLQLSNEAAFNHHQISIYCDQPRDLPTPSPLHFKLVKDLLGTQIERCRETLATAYRLGWAGRAYRRGSWDPESRKDESSELLPNPEQDAAIRIYGPKDEYIDANDIGGCLGHIHAVPQRLRAGFSLVRSVFSAGSLSRLDRLPPDYEEDPPFEIYRGWLRGLLNAATGLERNRRELEWVLNGSLYPDNVSDYLDEHQKTIEACKNDENETAVSALADWVKRKQPDGLPTDKLARQLWDYLSVAGLQDLVTIASPDNDVEKSIKDLKEGADGIYKVMAKARKLGLEKRQTTSYKGLRHPFYRDEIAWLYNERGLTSLFQGRIYDALPLFRQALFVMSHQKAPATDIKAFHAAERRIKLNEAVALIERGKISEARESLENLRQTLKHIPGSTPSKVSHYAQAYISLCDHLGGSFQRAIAGYEEALKIFVENRDLRAVSIFNRHLGDLYRRTNRLKRARRHIDLAVNAASQAEQRDVQYLAIASQASLLIALGETRLAKGRIERVKRYATQMGLYRLLADVLIADATLKMEGGEYGSAAEEAARSIALCSRHGMRLRKLSSLVVYGDIQVRRREYDLARGILEEAKHEAEKLGYQTQASLASDLLSTEELTA